MNPTSRNKNLLVIIAVLVLTNIAVLGYFLWFKKPAENHSDNRPRNGIADQLQKEVGFNEAQLAQYQQLKEKQREVIRPMFDEMRKAKDSLFRLLSTPETPDSVVSRAADLIAAKQKMLDTQTFSHFKRVRALCTPEQQPKYDSLLMRMFRKMGKPRSEGEKGEKSK